MPRRPGSQPLRATRCREKFLCGPPAAQQRVGRIVHYADARRVGPTFPAASLDPPRDREVVVAVRGRRARDAAILGRVGPQYRRVHPSDVTWLQRRHVRTARSVRQSGQPTGSCRRLALQRVVDRCARVVLTWQSAPARMLETVSCLPHQRRGAFTHRRCGTRAGGMPRCTRQWPQHDDRATRSPGEGNAPTAACTFLCCNAVPLEASNADFEVRVRRPSRSRR